MSKLSDLKNNVGSIKQRTVSKKTPAHLAESKPKVNVKEDSDKFKSTGDLITFDAKSAKIFIGHKMYLTLSKFFEKDFEKFFKKLNSIQKLTVINNFCNTFFPKEVKVEHEDPFTDWSTEELEAFDKHGIKPKGKVIYVGK